MRKTMRNNTSSISSHVINLSYFPHKLMKERLGVPVLYIGPLSRPYLKLAITRLTLAGTSGQASLNSPIWEGTEMQCKRLACTAYTPIRLLRSCEEIVLRSKCAKSGVSIETYSKILLYCIVRAYSAYTATSVRSQVHSVQSQCNLKTFYALLLRHQHDQRFHAPLPLSFQCAHTTLYLERRPLHLFWACTKQTQGALRSVSSWRC